jgi:CHAD domain-containing protein
MRSAILEYYEKHRHLILDNISLSAGEDNIEPIHDMRVSFKRLKILLQLLEKISSGALNAENEYLHFNRFYKISGRLRDFHVQKQLLDHYTDETGLALKEYDHYLSRGIIKRNLKFQQALDSFDTSFLEKFRMEFKSIVKMSTTGYVHTIAREIVRMKVAEISDSYKYDAGEKRFHKIRRSMKDLQYLNNILNDKLPFKKQLHIDSTRLTEIGQLLGSWHDKLTGVAVLGAFLDKQKGNIENVMVYHKLQARVIEDKEAEYQNLDEIFTGEIKLK